MMFDDVPPVAPPMQAHEHSPEVKSLAQRMDRQERALGMLRQDTAKRFGEMRHYVKTEIDQVRADVHTEFSVTNGKLDELIRAIGSTPKRHKLFGK